MKAPFNLNAAWLLLLSTFTAKANKTLHLRHTRILKPVFEVLCRIAVQDTMIGESNTTLVVSGREQIFCIPIVDEHEYDDMFPVHLPADMVLQLSSAIQRSEGFVSIVGATFIDGELIISENAEYKVLRELPSQLRHLQQRKLVTAGVLTLGVIRISTIDSTPKYSASELDDGIFGNGLENDGITIVSQYNACSFGKLKWTKSSQGIIDVKINQNVNSFVDVNGNVDYMVLITAVQKQLKAERGLSSIDSIADKVIMCVPPGTGTWAGSAAVGHWRVQVNSDWCLSLSGIVHELGHTMGLLHANENGVTYDDYTSYMAGGYTVANWPLKCFNGQNNNVLGWYSDRTLAMVPASGGAQLVKLAAFVDYNKTSVDEPVLLNIGDQFYIQYNRAKGMNVGSAEKQDKVTVTSLDSAGSNMLGGFDVGESFQQSSFGGTFTVKVCEKRAGTSSSPDVMVLSVGMGASICGQVETKSTFPIDLSVTVSAPKSTPI
jgi:Gametolysin peptidase M11